MREPDRLYNEAFSALAEALVASYVGLPWDKEIRETLRPKPPDIGLRTDVKWTRFTSGHLIVHHDDPIDWIFVLVRGVLPHMEIAGWATGHEAKNEEFLGNPHARNPEKDHFVPDSILSDPHLLPDMRELL